MARISGHGAVVRFQPVKGVTPKGALDRKLWLPCLLAPFEIDEDAQLTTYDTLSAGQFSQAAMGPATARRLRTGTLNTLTMIFDPPWMTVTRQDPGWVRARLYEILRSKKAVHMLITLRPPSPDGPEFDGTVQFSNVNRVLQQGEVDTRYLTVQFQEWRDAKVKRRTNSGQTGRKAGTSLPATKRLTATDTLSSLSYEFYGTYRFWRFIRDANGIPARFGAKTPLVQLGRRFRVGAKVKIPQIAGEWSPGQAAA